MDLKTVRLYYEDSYQTEFTARVLERSADGLRLCLDRTAFYPESGGQPCDLGWIDGVPVLEVTEEGQRVVHRLERPVQAEEVRGHIAWDRRFDHMQQHSGQHLLSAVLLELYGAPTVGFHIGQEVCTIDLAIASLSPEQAARAEMRANELLVRNLPVRAHWEQEALPAELRRAVQRSGPLRIVSIEGVDRVACGGTHVRATGEIGVILLRKLDRAHGGVRLEFVCGARAVRRARAEYETLAETARRLSAPMPEVPRLVAEQIEALEQARKAAAKATLELAEYRGRELYRTLEPDPSGLRCAVERARSGKLDQELRARAQSFARQSKAVFLALIADPPSLLLAASADSGYDAGALVREALAEVGGRGGGNAQIGQGSAPDPEALERALVRLEQSIPGLARSGDHC